MPLVGKVEKVAIRGFDFEWKIEKFSELETDGICYYSPEFCYEGQFWFLGIDPNGDSYNDSFGYINLYLYRKSSGPSTSLKFSLSLKTVNGKKNLERHCSGVFEQWNHHQYLRFVSRSELEKRKAALLPSDVLTVVCSIQNSKSAEVASDVSTATCSYCKETFDSEVVSSHEKKCTDKPIKCPECSDVILLLNWYDHECQVAGIGGRNSNILKFSGQSEKNKILQDFKKMFEDKEDCDVVIKVKETEFPAHRAVLKARSPVFASTLRHDMKEKKTGIIDIQDCDPSIFSDFLCFLYCEELNTLSDGNVFGLFTLADIYDIPDLREICREFMKVNISTETFCDTITLALNHSETELVKFSTDFFIKNAQKIIETVKWQSFLAQNPTQSNELFIKLLASNKNSNA